MTGRIAAAVAAIASIAVAAGCGGESRAGGDAERAQAPARVFVLGYPKHGAGDVKRVGIYQVTLPGGQVQRVPLGQLALGDYMKFIDVTGGHLVFLGPGGATYAVPTAHLSERPRRLGASWYFIPSTSPGRVWLTKLDTRSPATRRDLLGAQEVSVDGRVVTRGRSRPPCAGPTIVAAAWRTLLCQDRDELIAFDPQTGAVVDRLPGPFPLAAGGGLVASCGEPCPHLLVSDPAAGTRTALDHGAGWHWTAGYDGAFSDDGRLLAVPVEPHGTPDHGGMPRAVALVDLDTGAGHLIDGASTYADGPLDFAADGRLFLTTREGDLLAYAPGDASAQRVAHLPDVVVLDLAAE